MTNKKQLRRDAKAEAQQPKPKKTTAKKTTRKKADSDG